MLHYEWERHVHNKHYMFTIQKDVGNMNIERTYGGEEHSVYILFAL
jgi:hypothetical protein